LPRKKTDERDHRNAPWITKGGGIDLNRLPIGFVLKQALEKNPEPFRSSCILLTSMYSAGREEAAVFLYGLFIHYQGDRARKEVIAEALRHVRTGTSAEILFSELDRTDSSNTTRGYINTILTTLSRFPSTLVEEGFTRLLENKKWSYRMKRKFQAILQGANWRYL